MDIWRKKDCWSHRTSSQDLRIWGTLRVVPDFEYSTIFVITQASSNDTSTVIITDNNIYSPMMTFLSLVAMYYHVYSSMSNTAYLVYSFILITFLVFVNSAKNKVSSNCIYTYVCSCYFWLYSYSVLHISLCNLIRALDKTLYLDKLFISQKKQFG